MSAPEINFSYLSSADYIGGINADNVESPVDFMGYIKNTGLSTAYAHKANDYDRIKLWVLAISRELSRDNSGKLTSRMEPCRREWLLAFRETLNLLHDYVSTVTERIERLAV